MNTLKLVEKENQFRKEFEIFSYKNLGSVRTFVDERGEVWFCLKDVCDILGLGNPSKVLHRLNMGGVTTSKVGVQTGIRNDGTPSFQEVDMNFINESNLYETIFASRKPEAKEFRYWVVSEVLPTLRKNGAFGAPRHENAELENIYNVSKVIVNLYEENQKIKEFINKNEYAINEINEFVTTGNFDVMKKSTMIFSFEGVGLTNLVNWFKSNDIISVDCHPLHPYNTMGLFGRREIDHTRKEDGNEWFRYQIFITNKGIDYFTDELIKAGYNKNNIDLEAYQEGIITGWVQRIEDLNTK